jgi:hypothetical protein
MIRLTIYRLGETIEVELPLDDSSSFRSNTVQVYGRINDKGIREDIRYRPYYRRTIEGVLNVYAEEELSPMD